MSEEKKIMEYKPEIPVEGTETAEAAETGQRIVVKFNRPYIFEGKEYAEVDLSGLEGLTVKDAIDIQRQLFNQQEVAASLLTETTTAFARALAVKGTGRPVEFFQQMPRGASKLVCRAVREYMNVENATENHVMRLERPYLFDGREYREIDLNGIADLSSMHDSAAENRMAREGFMVTETSFNYLYACVIASMAAKLPEDFFTGLPLYETVKLKNAVNDAGFFE